MQNSPAKLDKKEIIDLLNRCWMTHDAMWFLNSWQEEGIEKANKINKAAIKSLAPIEMRRIKEALGTQKERVETFEEFKDFLVGASEFVIPDFMNIIMSFPGRNVLHWQFKEGNCFAYKGMKRIGAIDQYECGVIYRLGCWFDNLGIRYTVVPEINRCLMHATGNCSGDFRFDF
jgi:Family of unknown function (DUF6125)